MEYFAHLASLTESIVAFAREHQGWTIPLVFILAFLESFAFLSLLVPATAILLGISALVGTAGLPLLPLWLGCVIGSVLGYYASYLIGLRYKATIYKIWPFNRSTDAVTRATRFFEKYGAMSVFFGHFFGPVRAFIPVIAGSFHLDIIKFQIANLLSAALWSTSVLAPGFIAGDAEAMKSLGIVMKKLTGG